MNTAIERQVNPGMHIVTIARQGLKEVYITARPNRGEELTSLINRLAYSLQKQDAQVVKFDVFGPIDEFSACINSLENAYGQLNWPVTWVEGNRYTGDNLAGIQVEAVSGTCVETIFLENKPIARVFEDDFAKYCFLGNVLSGTFSTSQGEQARGTLENIEKALLLVGMDMSNVVRTWFYNDNIIYWYTEFNAVRTRFFKQRAVFDGLLPVSTGAGGKNPLHAALIASAIAIQAKKNNVTVQKLLSPLQCPASEYGSSFSRAVQIIMPDHRCILVSGTASIDASGKTAHIDDIDAQIAFTMEAVEAILLAQGMSYADVTRAIVYLKHVKDAPAFNKYCQNCAKPALPVVIVYDDICRDNLLFEIEVDAISKT